MQRTGLLLAAALFLCGCAVETSEPAPQKTEEPTPSAVTETTNEYDALIAEFNSEKELKEEYRGVFRILDAWIPAVKSAGEDAWEMLREKFAGVRSSLDEDMQKTGDMLEYAFDFMEAAFGESQEMVFFITELSANANAMWFIGENECPRYYRYNKSLLFEDRSAEVRKQLDEIYGEMIGEGDTYRI